MPEVEDWIHIIILISIGQGLFMAFVSFRKVKSISEPRFFLALILTIFSFILLYWITYWRGLGSITWIKAVTLIVSSTDTLLGPLIYFFVQSRVSKNFEIKWEHIRHFSLFIFLLLLSTHQVVFLLFDVGFFDIKSNPRMFRIVSLILGYVRLIQFGYYSALLFNKWHKLRQSWILRVALGFASYFVAAIGFMAMDFSNSLITELDYILSSIMIIAIYSISYIDTVAPKSYEKPKAAKPRGVTEQVLLFGRSL